MNYNRACVVELKKLKEESLKPEKTVELPPITCIDCGCEQYAPCKNGCSWIWAKGKRGLCSTCQDKWLAKI